MDRYHAYAEAHKGAVFIHQGETFVVESLDFKKHIIEVKKIDVDHHTRALRESDVEIIKESDIQTIGDLKFSFGDLKITQHFFKYKVMVYGKTLSEHQLELPPLKYKTKGLWFTIPSHIADELENFFFEKDVYAGSLHGVEHAIISMFPLLVICDRFDVGGLSTPYHPETGAATIFIYDAYEGGIGLSEKALENMEKLIDVTKGMVNSCQCDLGCPSCIYSPKCGNDNKPLHKKGTLFILEALLAQMKSKKIEVHPESLKTSSSLGITKGLMSSETYKEFNIPSKNAVDVIFKDFSDILKENLNSYNGEYEKIVDYGPDLFKLLSNLLGDKEINGITRIKVIAALAYFVTPNDIIPESIHGPKGLIDDIFLCSHVIKDIGSELGYEIFEGSWYRDENLQEVVLECYNNSCELLGSKTEDILAYVSLDGNSGNSYNNLLDKCLKEGESKKVEFKSTLRWDTEHNNFNKELEKVIAKSIAGFLNSNGGTLLIGIKDDGSIYGIENDCCSLKHRKNKDGFEQRLTQIIENYLGLNVIEHISICFVEKDDKNVCIVKVDPSPEPVILITKNDKVFYIRVGNATKPLDIENTLKYLQKHFH